MESEYVVVGGGVVGLAVAHGLLTRDHDVLVLDDVDTAFRASRANFGLVWVQSKGMDEPRYAMWTQKSVGVWRGFADELKETTGIDLHLKQDGGLDFFLSEDALAERVQQYETLREAVGGYYPYDVLDRDGVLKEEPHAGPNVIGATLHHQDGHVNSLLLLRALRTDIDRLKGRVRTCSPVESIEGDGRGFVLRLLGGDTVRADKVVLSLGVGAPEIARSLGFKAPVLPLRGQNLITEKLAPVIRRPAPIVRQVNEGGIQIGDSHEEVGFDDSSTLDMAAEMARNAIEYFPFLAKVRVVRSWAGLRPMTPDGLPIYQQSTTHPGAFMVTGHSGVTLAAANSKFLSGWLDGSADEPLLEAFNEQRFELQSAT